MLSFFKWVYGFLTKLMSCTKIRHRSRRQTRLVLSPIDYSSDDDMQYRIPLFEDVNKKKM